MLSPQLSLDVHRELVVDLFAGGGGASTGIEQAIGRYVDIAVNHDREAVALHQANHPQTRHYVSDVFEVDPREVTEGRPVGFLWASPDCTYHSKARGGKPHRDRNPARRRRGLAGVVIKWADLVRPRVIGMENVEEFRAWGPLLDDGTPCPNRRGKSFERWVSRLRNLGYVVEWREIRARDHGAPTLRKRLFIMARCDGQPIVWPDASHVEPEKAAILRLKPWLTIADCIDWSIPCPSIFTRKRPLADATCGRVAKGTVRYVIEHPNPFVAPGGTVVPFVTEHANASTQRNFAADEPLRTVCAQVKGGHFALVSAFLAKHYGGVIGTELTKPVGTITTKDHHSLVTSHMVKLRGDNVGSATNEPLHTISAQGCHHAEVRALLVKHTGRQDQKALVTIRGETYAIADLGMRMLTPRELYRAQGFPENYIIDCGVDPFTGKRVPLTKTAQIRMCGNSVCPPVARALVAANYREEVVVVPERRAANDQRVRREKLAA